MRCLSELLDVIRGETGRIAECQDVALDEAWDRLDPGLLWYTRRHFVRGRDRICDGVDKTGIERPGFGQMIDGLPLVETGHFNGELDGRAVSIDGQGPVACSGDWDDAAIDLRRELSVDPDLFVAGRLPLRQRRIIQEGKADGTLDLQRAIAFEKNRCRMGIDP